MKNIILSSFSAAAILAAGITASTSSANACGYRYYEPCQVEAPAAAAPAKVVKSAPKPKKSTRKLKKKKSKNRIKTAHKKAKAPKRHYKKKAPKSKVRNIKTATAPASRRGCCVRHVAPAPKPVAAPKPRRGCCVVRTARAAPTRCVTVTRATRRSCR